jgi:hypothetical protein
MQPEQIERDLPNGFHGARVESICINYVLRTAGFLVGFLVPIDEADPNSKSRIRRAQFNVAGLAFLSLDAPDPHYDYMHEGAIEIGSLSDPVTKFSPQILVLQEELGRAYFMHSFFVEEWNRFIHFAATDASFEWLED